MITMEMLGKVRRLYSRGKKSLHEIAKTTGLSRNTIRKWVRDPGEVAKPTYRRSKMPGKLTAFVPELELALKADAHRTKQNRRTGKALFLQIKAAGYTGGYSRVTDFIRAWRDQEGKARKAFVPLAFEVGEAFLFQSGFQIAAFYVDLAVLVLLQVDLALQAFVFVSQPPHLDQGQGYAEFLVFFFEFEIFLGAFGLLFQRFEVAFNFGQQVFYPIQVFAGAFEFAEGLFFAELVFGYPGRLFKHLAA